MLQFVPPQSRCRVAPVRKPFLLLARQLRRIRGHQPRRNADVSHRPRREPAPRGYHRLGSTGNLFMRADSVLPRA